MAHYTRTRIEDVSEAIAALRYGEMKELAQALADILNDTSFLDESNLFDASVLADVLGAWSSDTEDEVDAAKEQAGAE